MNLNTANLTLDPSTHALRTIRDKGFDPAKVRATFKAPTKVTKVTAHPGQVRLIGNGLALVGKVVGKRFVLITVYLDGVLTPPREDQMNTPEGRRYAERYARGLGRG
jgi:hypothetical protein